MATATAAGLSIRRESGARYAGVCRELIPAEYPMHALGIGQPDNVLECARMGYATFDSALPTRDARTGRLYAFTCDPNSPNFRFEGKWYRTHYIDDEKHIKADGPISPAATAWPVNDTLSAISATCISAETHSTSGLPRSHNLRFMKQMMELFVTGISEARLSGLKHVEPRDDPTGAA